MTTLAFDWHEPNWPAPLRVRFHVEDKGDRCQIAVTESGFDNLTNGATLRLEHENGWRYHLAQLCQQAEQ